MSIPHVENGQGEVMLVKCFRWDMLDVPKSLALVALLDDLSCILLHCWPEISYTNNLSDK